MLPDILPFLVQMTHSLDRSKDDQLPHYRVAVLGYSCVAVVAGLTVR